MTLINGIDLLEFLSDIELYSFFLYAFYVWLSFAIHFDTSLQV